MYVCKAGSPYIGPVVISKPLTLSSDAGTVIETLNGPAAISVRSSGVELSDLTIQSRECGVPYGIDARGQSLRLSGVTVRRIPETRCDGGTGIHVAGRASILNTTVEGYGESGISIDGAGTSAEVRVSWIRGGRNGIVFSRGATGKVVQSKITGAGTGILVSGGCGDPVSTGVQVVKNTLTGNRVSLKFHNLSDACDGTPPIRTDNLASSNLIDSMEDIGNYDKFINNNIAGHPVPAVRSMGGSTLVITHEVSPPSAVRRKRVFGIIPR